MRVQHQQFPGIVLILAVLHTVSGGKQAQGLPCLPHIAYEQIRQPRMGTYFKLPVMILLGNREGFCPLPVFRGDAAIFFFLLYGIGQHPVHTVEAILLDDRLRQIRPQLLAIIVFGNDPLDGHGAVAVDLITFPPEIFFLMPDSLLQRMAVKGLSAIHKNHRPFSQPI